MADYPFTGTWHMIHDNWVGTLVLTVTIMLSPATSRPCVHLQSSSGHVYASGRRRAARRDGTGRRRDPSVRSGQPCPQSDHGINFTIAFPSAPPQPFKGYFFIQSGPAYLAGLTWWQGSPFGWFADKI